MRVLLVCLLAACATDVDDADDPAWAEATDPDMAAELEDPEDDDAVMEDLVDDTDDGAEVDEGELLAPAKFANPLGPNCADPGVIKVDASTYYAACTGNGYPLFKSSDLVHWKAAGKIFSLATKPKWAGGNWWAPEIHANGDGFIAYFTALSPSRGKMCIGAARAKTIAGPWKDIGRPLVCDSHVSLIDATAFTDASGKRYLYYKTDGNGLSPKEQTILYGHQLRADGIGFVGKRRALLRNTLAWEGDVVEAPWLHHRGNFYYMFYSGFRYCNATYGTGVARSRSPLGPFAKRSAPILRSNATWSGPGHNSIVRSGGRAWIVYHAWSGAHDCDDGGARKLMLDPITWKGGWPTVGNGTPSRGPVSAP